MNKQDTGIMVVNRFEDGYVVSGAIMRRVNLGETYVSDTGYPVYKDAVTTLKENPYPYAVQYLRVRAVTEPIPVIRNDAKFFLVHKIEVLEEVALSELRKNPEFDAACAENEKEHEAFEEWFDKEMDNFEIKREVEERLFHLRYRKKQWILTAVVLLLIASYIVVTRNLL